MAGFPLKKKNIYLFLFNVKFCFYIHEKMHFLPVQTSLEAFWLAPLTEDKDHFKNLSGKSCRMLSAAFRQNKASLVSELTEACLRPERHSDMNMNVTVNAGDKQSGFLGRVTVCNTYPSHPRCKRAGEAATQFDDIWAASSSNWLQRPGCMATSLIENFWKYRNEI